MPNSLFTLKKRDGQKVQQRRSAQGEEGVEGAQARHTEERPLRKEVRIEQWGFIRKASVRIYAAGSNRKHQSYRGDFYGERSAATRQVVAA
jgi:hypothetical protein